MKTLVLAFHHKPKPDPNACPVCEGKGTIIKSTCNSHCRYDCSCEGEEVDCARCSGSGRVCLEDGEPLDELGNCHACIAYAKSQREAEEEDKADARREEARHV